jgi:hypothetical protein
MVRVAAGLSFHSLLKKGKHRRFFRRQPGQRAPQFHFSALLQGRDQRTIHVGVDDRRMDVALATDRPGIPQPLRHLLDCGRDVAFGGGIRIEVFKLLERLSGERGTGPGAKILGCKVLATDFRRYSLTSAEPISWVAPCPAEELDASS